MGVFLYRLLDLPAMSILLVNPPMISNEATDKYFYQHILGFSRTNLDEKADKSSLVL